jgi:hypothetical protein
MAGATCASSSFIKRRISGKGKELKLAVFGFSCSVIGSESVVFIA